MVSLSRGSLVPDDEGPEAKEPSRPQGDALRAKEVADVELLLLGALGGAPAASESAGSAPAAKPRAPEAARAPSAPPATRLPAREPAPAAPEPAPVLSGVEELLRDIDLISRPKAPRRPTAQGRGRTSAPARPAAAFSFEPDVGSTLPEETVAPPSEHPWISFEGEMPGARGLSVSEASAARLAVRLDALEAHAEPLAPAAGPSGAAPEEPPAERARHEQKPVPRAARPVAGPPEGQGLAPDELGAIKEAISSLAIDSDLGVAAETAVPARPAVSPRAERQDARRPKPRRAGAAADKAPHRGGIPPKPRDEELDALEHALDGMSVDSPGGEAQDLKLFDGFRESGAAMGDAPSAPHLHRPPARDAGSELDEALKSILGEEPSGSEDVYNVADESASDSGWASLGKIRSPVLAGFAAEMTGLPVDADLWGRPTGTVPRRGAWGVWQRVRSGALMAARALRVVRIPPANLGVTAAFILALAWGHAGLPVIGGTLLFGALLSVLGLNWRNLALALSAATAAGVACDALRRREEIWRILAGR